MGTEDKDMKEVIVSQTSKESSTSTDSEESEEQQLEKEIKELQWANCCVAAKSTEELLGSRKSWL